LNLKDNDASFLREVWNHKPKDTTSQPRRIGPS